MAPKLIVRALLVFFAGALGICSAACSKRGTPSANGIAFVRIEPGRFAMGSTYAKGPPVPAHAEWYEDEQPVHEVAITEPFWLAMHETTYGEFARFVEATGYETTVETSTLGTLGPGAVAAGGKGWTVRRDVHWREPGFTTSDRHAVVHVSWADANAYCRWLSKNDPKFDYALPTEAQWEYVARAAGTYPWGDGEPSRSVANIADSAFLRAFPKWSYPVMGDYDDGHALVAPVGSYPPNPLGIHDLGGNVWEWTQDYYSPTFYASSPTNDPRGPPRERARRSSTGVPLRVHRGGGFDWELPFLRAAKRRARPEDYSAVHIGFRVAAYRKGDSK